MRTQSLTAKSTFLLAALLALAFVPARSSSAQSTFTGAIEECLDRAADAFVGCVESAQESGGWFVMNAREAWCAIRYQADGVACIPIEAMKGVVGAAT